MEADWQDWKHVDDLLRSVADIEAELPDLSGELPRIPAVGNAWANVGSDDDALNLNRVSGRSGAVSSVATRPVPRCKCSSRRMMTAAPVCVPLDAGR